MSGIWDFIVVYDRGDGRAELVPNYFYDKSIHYSDFYKLTTSTLRSPFILLKNRLGINFFDESFDEDIHAIVRQSLQFTADIGAHPIINGRMVDTPRLLDYDSALIPYKDQERRFFEHGIDPKKDARFFHNYYSWYEIFKSPLDDPYVKQSYDEKSMAYNNYFSHVSGLFNTLGEDRLLTDFTPPAETQLNSINYCRTLEDLLVLIDELCYVNAKIYFDSPDSGYVTNQFAQRKGELQWRIQSLLEDRMNIGYGPVEPSVIP